MATERRHELDGWVVNRGGVRWDRRALRTGATITLLVAVPPSLLARLLADDSSADQASGWAPVLFLVSVLAFVAGGLIAAQRQGTGAPLSHALVVTGGVFLAVQAVFVGISLGIGNEIRPGRMLVSFSFAVTAGVIGGVVGSYRQQRHHHPTQHPNPSPT